MTRGSEAASAATRGALQPRERERGSTLVQTLLILPVFLLVVIGGYEVWKAHSVRESLRSGVYQATRYLSFNPNTSNWHAAARSYFIVPELINNPLAGREVANQVLVDTPPPILECGETFTIRAELPWRTVIPFVEREDWTFEVSYEGEVFCAPQEIIGQ